MTAYRIRVRLELDNEDTGAGVTWDDEYHHFEAERADGGHPDYVAIQDAVSSAIATLAAQRQGTEGETK